MAAPDALRASIAGAQPASVRRRPGLGASAFAFVIVANAAAVLYLWWAGGNVTHVHSTGDALTSAARITGLLSAYLALVQVLLLARLPWLERMVGFDRLTLWHRWNGHACIDLLVAHVVFSVWGYALLDRITVGNEVSRMLGGGVYPGMIVATVGTGLLLAVVATSVVIVRRRLRYEWWYAVHLAAYAGIALGWFHQIPTGNELVVNPVAADWWRALYAATLAMLLWFRVAVPLTTFLRHRLRVIEVVQEAPGFVSIRVAGRSLDRLGAQAGQFFLWRFLTPGRWWASHPFSLSEAPDGRSLRITVKALGDFSAGLASIRPGARVAVEGPFGVFTNAVRRCENALLVAGGIGITPVRGLLERMDGDIVVLYRVTRDSDAVLRDELEALARARGARLEVVAGDHTTPAGARLLSCEHLAELVPDLAERDAYVCGPPAMTDTLVGSLRRAGVPARQIHVERFAL